MKWSDTQSRNVQSQDADCVGATIAYFTLMVVLYVGVVGLAIFVSWFLR